MIRSHSDNYFNFHNSLHCRSLINVTGSSIPKKSVKKRGRFKDGNWEQFDPEFELDYIPQKNPNGMRSVYCFVGTCSTIKSVYKTVYPECLMLTAKEAMTLRSGRKEKRRALCLIGLTPHKDKGKGNTLLVLTSQKPCKLFRGIRQLGANVC